MSGGIEAIGLYGGRAFIDVAKMAEARGLNRARFDNLLIRRKTVTLPFEDPVTLAVNAAKPLVDALSPAKRESIELLIVASESGVDFGKSMATYAHHYLSLPRHSRLFEVKQACYGGTAALQMALAHVRMSSRDARALVICTDTARPVPHSYAEPTQGAAGVALLVGREPEVLEVEPVSGVYGYEVMDACRPTPDMETGDADLSLLSYLDCMQNAFAAYRARAGEVDFQEHFAYLACHTPFGGMVKGAHRTMMRKFKPMPPPAVEADFRRRVEPSLRWCQEVGNIYSGTVFLALAGLLDAVPLEGRTRIGLFSYGSGCCSEFYSGIADRRSHDAVRRLRLDAALADRQELPMDVYDRLLAAQKTLPAGIRDAAPGTAGFDDLYHEGFAGRGLLVLDQIANYHRRYRWS